MFAGTVACVLAGVTMNAMPAIAVLFVLAAVVFAMLRSNEVRPAAVRVTRRRRR